MILSKTATLFLAASACLALIWIGLRALEKANLYIPDRVLTALPATYGLSYSDMFFTAEDGVRLHGWFVPGPRGSLAPMLVFFHGNAGNMSHRMDKLRIFHELGLAVFLFDYRGYGQSSGEPSEKGLYKDALAAVRVLTEERGLPMGQTLYYGESLGAAIALETALQAPPRAVILDSAFTSTVDMGRLIFPWLPVKWIVRQRYDNLQKISKLSCPLLLLHSSEDEIIPFSMAQGLYEAAPQPKELVKMRGDHNQGFLETPSYGENINRFLEKYLQPTH